MKTPDIFIALKPVIHIFEKLSIPYYIGGSIASSIFGMARATMDVDIVADIDSHQIPPLKKHLENDYYIDEGMIKEAIRKKSSFNLIHLETVLKIDVFIYKDEPYQRSVFQRKLKDTLEEDSRDTVFYFSSPEDTIINKLIWYKLGGEVSERQWLDVIGVIKVQRDLLDKDYLKDWSQRMQILGLLEKTFNESGIEL
jgi:hypothetical protein